MKISKAVNQMRQLANVIDNSTPRVSNDSLHGARFSRLLDAATGLRTLATQLEANPPACVHCEEPDLHPKNP